MTDAVTRFAPNERHETLPNGLRLHLLPRPDFHQMVAMVTVDFGARDQSFEKDGQLVKQPAGLAHFLEHKLFAQPGYDAFSRLSELGANANAFTTQTRTSYFLTAPANEYEALKELLTFTQEPYFEAESVAREQDIISQEVDMYQDDTNARLYRLILGQLFKDDPMADDIAGTTESVHSVTPEDLQLAFDAFYRPDNMDVVIAGAFDETTVRDLINASPAGQRPAVAPVSVPTHELQPVSDNILEVEMDVVRPKVAMGQRWYDGADMPTGREALRIAIAGSLAVDLVFGEFSPTYMTWYDSGMIDDSFSAEFDWERGVAFLTIAAETPEADELIDAVADELENMADRFAALQADFELVKKDALGRLINKLNQLEEIVTRFEGSTFDFATLRDEINILQALTFTDVLEILRNAQVSALTTVIATPNALDM